jgi:hypothetical protein
MIFVCVLLMCWQEPITLKGQYIRPKFEDGAAIEIKLPDQQWLKTVWHVTGTRFFIDGREVRRNELPNLIHDDSSQVTSVHAYTR